jgi:hypothetical protein
LPENSRLVVARRLDVADRFEQLDDAVVVEVDGRLPPSIVVLRAKELERFGDVGASRRRATEDGVGVDRLRRLDEIEVPVAVDVRIARARTRSSS